MAVALELLFSAEKQPNLEEAKQLLARIQEDSQKVIKILTAEQALKAQGAVREAGQKRR